METNVMLVGREFMVLFKIYGSKNDVEFCVQKEKSDYWGQVDLYIGGAELLLDICYILDFGLNFCLIEVL